MSFASQTALRQFRGANLNLTTIMRLGAILLLPAATVLLCGQEKQAGYVLAVTGQWIWVSKGNPKVSPGDPANENATARSADQKAKLTVGMLDGTVKAFDCPPLNPCVASIGAFRAPPESLATRLFAVGKTFLAQRNTMPVYAISRGGSAGVFQHAVLALSDQRLEIGPAIMRLEPGVYSLRLRSLQGSAGSNTTFTWDPPQSTSAMLPGLKPGVYELVFSSREGMRLGSTPALVSPSDAAAAKQAALDDGKRITRAWPLETDPAAIYNFLTAYLLDLAGR